MSGLITSNFRISQLGVAWQRVLIHAALAVLFCLSISHCYSQDNPNLSYSYSKNTLAINEVFSITLSLKNEEIKSYSPLPDIPGFVKKRALKNTSSEDIMGDIVIVNTLVQEYTPVRLGRFTLPSIPVTVNGTIIRLRSANIIVTQAATTSQSTVAENTSPTQEEEDALFSEEQDESSSNLLAEFNLNEKGQKIFLSLTADKKELYVREPFHLRLSLLVPSNNKKDIEFFELEKQINQLLKTIKPTNCWEEDFGLEEVQEYAIRLKNKSYTEYRIFEASYYPLSTGALRFPKVSLKMNLPEAKGKMPSGVSRLVDKITSFQSEPFVINVKPLPNHPLAATVPVGTFVKSEQISRTKFKTGQPIRYFITFKGNGIPSSLVLPDYTAPNGIDILLNSNNVSISRRAGKVITKRQFKFQIVGYQPGTYRLDNLSKFVFFDPNKQRYDTLISNIKVQVSGKRIAIKSGSPLLKNPFYSQRITKASSQIYTALPWEEWQWVLNIGLGALLVIGLALIFWKR